MSPFQKQICESVELILKISEIPPVYIALGAAISVNATVALRNAILRGTPRDEVVRGSQLIIAAFAYNAGVRYEP